MILSIQGHVLILRHAKLKDLLNRATQDGMMPFSVSQEGDVYQLSIPCLLMNEWITSGFTQLKLLSSQPKKHQSKMKMALQMTMGHGTHKETMCQK